MTVIDVDPYLRDYASPTVDRQSASVIQIESNKLLPIIILLAVMTGLSIGMAMYAINQSRIAERESRLQRLETDELKAALMNAGIKIHQETDSP